MPKFLVINEVRQSLEIEAIDANHAVRVARDAPLTDWQVGDKDEIEVYDEDGNDVDFDWTDVEELWGQP